MTHYTVLRTNEGRVRQPIRRTRPSYEEAVPLET
jgi:hypothetical protein